MRPIQWYLKNLLESLEKIIPVPTSLLAHLKWLDQHNVLHAEPLHSLQHALQLFIDASNQGWDAHLDDCTAKGPCSKPESNMHINFLKLKTVLLALKKFKHLTLGQTILVVTDNCCVGHKQGSAEARQIPGHLNVIADKLSRHRQMIQTE